MPEPIETGMHTKNVDWMIEEYKALRAEILANQEYQKSLLIVGSTVLATALGFIYRGNEIPNNGIPNNGSLILFLTEILAASFWYAFQRLGLATEEIGTYIQFRMEAISALNWETFQRAEPPEITLPGMVGPQTVGAVALSTCPPMAAVEQPANSQSPRKYTWRNKKSIGRRVRDSFSQLPFFIFSLICFIWIIKTGFSDDNIKYIIFSSIVIIIMSIRFIYLLISINPKSIRENIEQHLGYSAAFRRKNQFFVVPELERFPMNNSSSPPPHFLDREAGRKRIEQEDNLVNHRLTWLIGSQAFLLTAFVLLRNNPSYYPSDPNTLNPLYLARTELLVYLIAVSGLLIAACSSIGVFAAFMAIIDWRSKVILDERRGLTSRARWTFFGGLAAFLPGPVLACNWVLLLAAEWPLARVTPVQFWSPIVVAILTLGGWFCYTWYAFSLRTIGEDG